MIDFLLANQDTLLYIEAGIAAAGIVICAIAIIVTKKGV